MFGISAFAEAPFASLARSAAPHNTRCPLPLPLAVTAAPGLGLDAPATPTKKDKGTSLKKRFLVRATALVNPPRFGFLFLPLITTMLIIHLGLMVPILP